MSLAVFAAGRLPSDLVMPISAVPFAMAVIVIVVGLVRVVPSRRVAASELAASLGLGLEFFLAAGLIRLAAINDFGALGLVAAVVLFRRVIGLGVRYAVQAARSPSPGGLRA